MPEADMKEERRGDAGAGGELRARRERIAQTMLNVLLPVGLVAYIPGVWLSIQEGVWLVAVLDTIAYLAVVYAWFLPRERYRLRGAILVGCVYVLGTGLCLALGVIGAGPLWLAATPLVAALFFDRRHTMMALAVTVATAALIALPLGLGMLEWPATEASLALWLMMAGSIVAVSSILSVAVASLLEGMLESAKRAERVGGELAAERTRLVEANARLRREMEERQQAEAMLRQSEKLTAIGTLAGGIAHDFNNLLTAIRGYGQMVLEELAPSDPLRSDAREIIMASERGAALVRQLMAFSRQQVVQPDVLSLNSVVAGMKPMLERLLGEDVDLITRLDPATASVRADRGQIEQVLLNLVVNARDAMPGGGRLSISTSRVGDGDGDLAGGPPIGPGNHLLLSVSDTGSGIPADVVDKIFEPFFTTKEEGKGTGLGLSTVHGIVEQSGGQIWVESEPGAGATFTVCLPEVEPLPPTAEADPAEVASPGSGTVLLVEDQPSVRALARRILERNGYRVREAATGGEALQLCEGYDGPLDLLLTDVVMPRMSGRELAERLQEIRPGLPVLFMSGYAEDEIAHRGVLEPGTHFIEKPFSPEAFARKVQEVLAAARRGPPPHPGGRAVPLRP